MLTFLRATLRTRLRSCRFYAISALEYPDLRPRLLAEIKVAMKARDSKTTTTLRSVLSEINSVEKTNPSLTPSDMISITRKAVQRRVEAASKFTEANRPDLAKKEQEEAELLEQFLPPLLSSAEIDVHIQAVLEMLPAGTDPRKTLGVLFKEFYARVDKNQVDPNVVKQRAQDLLATAKSQ